MAKTATKTTKARAGTTTPASTATLPARSGTTGGGTGGGGTAAPLGIPSGGAAIPTTAAQSALVQAGVNWSNVQQQFPTIAWQQTQLASLMTAINLGPAHYPNVEYQAMLTQFRNICGQQMQLFERLHLGSRELVNA
jgi:hypothetical protein